MIKSNKIISDEPLFAGHTEPGKAFTPWDVGAKRRLSAEKSVATDFSDAVQEKTVQADDFFFELQSLYPEFTFLQSNRFKFRYPKTIYVDPSDENFALLSLHELGHALCQHRYFTTDAERLKIEREAWERARTVFLEHPAWAKKYHFHFDDNFVETQLDTYRDWLHTKSTCKKCGLTRYQTPHGSYHCPRCDLLLKSL